MANNNGMCLPLIKRFTLSLAYLILFLFVANSSNLDGSIDPDTVIQLLNESSDEQKLNLLLVSSEKLANSFPKNAIDYAEMAIALALKLEDSEKLAKAYYLLAKSHFIVGNYNEAIESLDFSHNQYSLNNDSIGLTETHQLYGQIFTRIGDFKKALDNTQLAFSLAGKLQLKQKLPELVRETGNIYFYFGEKAIALDFYQKSLKIAQENNNQDAVAKAYNNLGRLYSEMGNYNQALDCLRKSLGFKNKEDDRVSYGNTLMNLGVVYQNMGNHSQAIEYFEQSYQLFSSVGNAEGTSNSLYHLGLNFLRQKKFNQALAIFEDAWAMASSTNSKRLLVQLSESIAETYSEIGDYRRAYQHFRKYDELREEVYGEEKTKLLLELEARYQIQAKERQIELLSKDKKLKESEKNTARILVALLSIIILFLISLSYFIYSRFRYKSKANEELVQEIAYRKMVEGKLQVFQDDLETLVEERTQELKAAKEKAEESDKLKTAFLTNMSHEIRTPMNAIVGFSYLLSDPESTEEAKSEYTKIIRSNGEILMNLISDILDISMIESGQLKVKPKHVHIPKLFEELKLFYDKEKERYKKHEIEIIQIIDREVDDLTLNTDRLRLHQILTNLLSNAIKFTEEGVVSFGYQVCDEDEVLFFVKDTGKEIPPSKHQEIFNRFSKLSSSNEPKLYSGTGLGLAICSEMVKMLGGRIWLDSYPGKGSTFYFTLPHKQGKDSQPPKSKLAIKYDPKKLTGKTILIAEDVVSNYQLVSAFLEKTDVNVIWVQNGVEAVDVFKSNRNIDIILMDVQMPIMDGLKALEKIRKLDATIPVIVNTAFYLVDEMERSYAAGCTDYMTKPIKKDELLSKISLYIS